MGTDREMDADTGGTQITDPATFPAADATYYAQWTEKAAVDVTFTSGEGVWNDGTIAEKKVPTKPDLKATIPGTVSRAGYTFDGWQSDNAAYPSLDAGATETAVIREGQAVYYTPKWSAKTYTIRFDKNGQQDATGTVNDQTYVYETADAKLTTDVFTSTTHKMLGWDLTQNADVASYVISYNPIRRQGISKDNMIRLREVYPEIYEQFVETSESRRFSIKIAAQPAA